MAGSSTVYRDYERHDDKRWVECRVPGCHRSEGATIHKPFGFATCSSCAAGGHPYWLYVVRPELHGTVPHHAYTRAYVFVARHPAVKVTFEGVEFDD